MSEKSERDQRALQLFLAGATYQQIAATAEIDLKLVHDVVERQLGVGSSRRGVLTSEAKAIHQERTEALFRAHWAPALRGDHRSAEICRKILDQQSRSLTPDEATEPKVDLIDEIAARRAARRSRSAARANRAERSS